MPVPRLDPPSDPGVLGRLRGVGDRLGWPVGLLYLAHRVLRAVSGGRADLHCYRLVTQPVRAAALLPDRLRGSLEVRVLAPDDPERARALSQPADLPRRQARGDTCLAAFQDGRMVGYLWLCFAPFDDDETLCRFAPREGEGEGGAWDFDLSVAPENRGGAVFAALWDGAWSVLRQGGYRWTASRVSAFNDLSLRSHARIGARPAGAFLVLRAGGCRAVLATVRPHVRLAGRNARYARVEVRAPRDRPV
jgi:GNAT superfamily N-acetyltransferase